MHKFLNLKKQIYDQSKVIKDGGASPNRLLSVKYFQNGDDGGKISLDNTKGGMTDSDVEFQENQWYKEKFVE